MSNGETIKYWLEGAGKVTKPIGKTESVLEKIGLSKIGETKTDSWSEAGKIYPWKSLSNNINTTLAAPNTILGTLKVFDGLNKAQKAENGVDYWQGIRDTSKGVKSTIKSIKELKDGIKKIKEINRLKDAGNSAKAAKNMYNFGRKSKMIAENLKFAAKFPNLNIVSKVSAGASAAWAAIGAFEWVWRTVSGSSDSPIDTYIRKPFTGDWDRLDAVCDELIKIANDMQSLADSIEEKGTIFPNDSWTSETSSKFSKVNVDISDSYKQVVTQTNNMATGLHSIADFAKNILDYTIESVLSIVDALVTIGQLLAMSPFSAPVTAFKIACFVCDIFTFISNINEMISAYEAAVNSFTSVKNDALQISSKAQSIYDRLDSRATLVNSDIDTGQNSNSTSKKDTDKLADEMIRGDYGNGEDRKNALRKLGYTDTEISEAQAKVNVRMASGDTRTHYPNDSSQSTKTGGSSTYNPSGAGTQTVSDGSIAGFEAWALDQSNWDFSSADGAKPGGINVDGAYGAQCWDLSQAYYSQNGGSGSIISASPYQNVYGWNPDAPWSKVDTGVGVAGDIGYSTGAGQGHTFVILEDLGDSYRVLQQNPGAPGEGIVSKSSMVAVIHKN